MIAPKYFKVLRKLNSRLNDTKVNWAVTGSLSLMLQGLQIEPKDIDIKTNESGVYEIEKCFSEFVTKKVIFSIDEKICSHFGVLMIEGVKVEIMGDVQMRHENGTWEQPLDITAYKRIVEVEGMQIPVLPLEYEYKAYLKLGRFERVELLKKVLIGKDVL